VLLFCAALLSILTTLGILFSLLSETVAFLGEVGLWDFVSGKEWAPLFADPTFGVLPLVTGTLLVTGLALIVAIPLGLGTAIYLAEYAKPRTRRIVKPFIE
jgi:phosphate transport system permease protein